MMLRALFLGLLLLTGCSSDPQPDPIHLDYSQWGKITLNTQDLRIIDRSTRIPHAPPYVGHLFQPTLAEAVTRYASDRLQVGGQLGHATLIIRDASVSEQPLTTEKGIQGMFTREQGSKYIGRVEISLEAQSPKDASVGIANAHAVHVITLPEEPNAYEKYKTYEKLLEALMARLNTEFEASIRNHMAPFLTPTPAAAQNWTAAQ